MFHRQFFRFATKKNFGKLAYIVAAKRTPIGSYLGKLSRFTAVELAAITIKQTLNSIKLDSKHIDEVILGNALQGGIGQAPARQAALRGGVNRRVPCTTINKVCSSGMKAVMLAAQSIGTGYNNVVLTGGFESMSNAPSYLVHYRRGVGFGDQKIWDSVSYDGLMDVQNNIPLGACAEKTASSLGITRQAQDDYTILAYSRVGQAIRTKKYDQDVIPIRLDKENIVDEDEEYKRLNKQKLRLIPPLFTKHGTITIASSSKVTDGACIILLMSQQQVANHNLNPLGRIVSYAEASVDPLNFIVAPSYAINTLFQYTDMNINQIDSIQINQAYSAAVLANMKMLPGASIEKVNEMGGAVALGHPLAMSGARILQSLLTTLKHKNGKYGIASTCNGGGGGCAVLVENLHM